MSGSTSEPPTPRSRSPRTTGTVALADLPGAGLGRRGDHGQDLEDGAPFRSGRAAAGGRAGHRPLCAERGAGAPHSVDQVASGQRLVHAHDDRRSLLDARDPRRHLPQTASRRREAPLARPGRGGAPRALLGRRRCRRRRARRGAHARRLGGGWFHGGGLRARAHRGRPSLRGSPRPRRADLGGRLRRWDQRLFAPAGRAPAGPRRRAASSWRPVAWPSAATASTRASSMRWSPRRSDARPPTATLSGP